MYAGEMMRPLAPVLAALLVSVACGDDGGQPSTASAGTTTGGTGATTGGPTTGASAGTTGGTAPTSTSGGTGSTGQVGETGTTTGGVGETTTAGTTGGTTGEPGTGTTGTTEAPGSTGGPPPPKCNPVAPTQPPGDCAQIGVSIEPPYDQYYTCYDLGEMPGVPKEWGGVIVEKDDPYVLLAGGAANTAQGRLFAVSIARDEECHIVGYQAKATADFAAAEYNDGGLTYEHATSVLFLARWPVNELGQLKPGSNVTDKVIPLGPLGVVSSPGGFTFVPPGFAGEGKLKAVSWPGGEWYTMDLAADGGGTFDVVKATQNTKIAGGPEAFVYISDENPEFAVDGLLVAEWSAGNIAAYEADADGNPKVETRKLFIGGLEGAESAYVDPLSGDFLFATFAGDERLIAVRGFQPQPQ